MICAFSSSVLDFEIIVVASGVVVQILGVLQRAAIARVEQRVFYPVIFLNLKTSCLLSVDSALNRPSS